MQAFRSLRRDPRRTRRQLHRATGAALFLALANVALAGPAACPSGGEQTAIVAAVVDPATLRLADGSLIHLAGIDVPAWAASVARPALGRLIPPDTPISFTAASDQPDRYGRRHAFVFLAGDRLLETELVASGAARARWLPGEGVCFATLLAGEHRARRAVSGLWASSQAILAANDPSLVRQSGLYEVVAGRVVSVGHGTQLTFLDFGHDRRRDFTVMLSAPVAKALTAALGSVDALVNKQLLVRGVIANDHGAAVRVNDAAEIELLDDPPKP